METLLEITDVEEGMFEDAAALIAESDFPDMEIKSARIVGPVAKHEEGSYLSCHFRDENESPVAACYLQLLDPSGSVTSVDTTVTL